MNTKTFQNMKNIAALQSDKSTKHHTKNSITGLPDFENSSGPQEALI